MLAMAVVGVLVLGAVALGAWGTWRDAVAADALWRALRPAGEPDPPRYDPAMVAALPEIAQRYFARAIAPGTPLCRRVELRMQGTFLMNGRRFALRARQIIAPPHGFVWKARMGSGAMRFAGSDAFRAGVSSWTRFRLLGLIPVARTGGGPDHASASATRMLSETVWVPASLLPQNGAIWRPLGADRAEVSFPTDPMVKPVVLTLDRDGNVVEIVTLRWSDANPEARYRLQPFGARMLAHAECAGFTIPSEVEVGNQYGTPDYTPFFHATLSAVDFLP